MCKSILVDVMVVVLVVVGGDGGGEMDLVDDGSVEGCGDDSNIYN